MGNPQTAARGYFQVARETVIVIGKGVPRWSEHTAYHDNSFGRTFYISPFDDSSFLFSVLRVE